MQKVNGLVQGGVAIGLALWAVGVLAQTPPPILSGVYTCTDAKGRKLTADRPIPECTDREQKVLNPSGTIRAKVGPTLTTQEKADLDLKEKREIEARNKTLDERRRDRALLIRYPNKEVHDGERREALAQIMAVSQAAKTRLAGLMRQRVVIDDELEFYKKDPTKTPFYVRRQQEENMQSQAVQKRFIDDQDAEIRRVDVRFDDELVRLRQLWSQTK
jgi:hypothetical protein